MLGRQHGFYSDVPAIGWRIDSAIDGVEDMWVARAKYHYEKDEEKKKAACANFFDSFFPAWCNIYDKRIAANTSKHHLVGDNMTIADFAMAGYAYANIFNTGCSFHKELQAVLENYPNFKEYLVHLGEHNLKDFLASRPSPRTF